MKDKKVPLKKIAESVGYPVFSVCLVVLLWQIAAQKIGVEVVLPAPKRAASEFFRILGERSFYVALGSSLWRSVVCFALSAVIAAGLALLSAAFPPVYRVLSPIVSVLRALPTMAVILLFFIWTSARQTPSFVAALVTFPLLFSGFYGALTGVDGELLEMMRVYRVPLFRKALVYAKETLAPALKLLKSAVGLNLKVLIAAEVMVSTKNSLGNLMMMAKVELDTSALFAYTVAAVLLSAALEGLFALLERVLVRWKRG